MFNRDQTFTRSQPVPTSSTTVDAQIDSGTFTVTGNTITMTPTQSSCPGPDPVSTFTYSFQGNNLIVALSLIDSRVFQPADSTANDMVTVGCFVNGDSDAFTPEGLAPVRN